jgi:hypothetical protein
MKERSDTLYLWNTIIGPIDVLAMRLFRVVNQIEGASFGNSSISASAAKLLICCLCGAGTRARRRPQVPSGFILATASPVFAIEVDDLGNVGQR